MPKPKTIDLTKPITPTKWETQCAHWFQGLEVSTAGLLSFHRHSPPMRGKIRLPSGLADYEVMYSGKGSYIECKLETGSSLSLGAIDSAIRDDEVGAGVKPSQAREFDKFLKSGGHGWIAARLEVPALAPRGKQAKLLDAGRKEQAIQRLVPWADWRRLLLGGTRSVPYAEFEILGYPLRGPDDLLRALQSVSRLDATAPTGLQ